MKYAVILCEGAVRLFSDRSFFADASMPVLDRLAAVSESGIVRLEKNGGSVSLSDHIFSCLGAEMNACHGEAALAASDGSAGVLPDDVVFFCELTGLTEGEGFGEGVIIPCGNVSEEEGRALFEALDSAVDNDVFRFGHDKNGKGFFIWKQGEVRCGRWQRTDGCFGKTVSEVIPQKGYAELFAGIFQKCSEIMLSHPVNEQRIRDGKKPVAFSWIYSPGFMPVCSSLESRFSVRGSFVSDNRLADAAARCCGLHAVEVDSAEKMLSSVTEQFENGADIVFAQIDSRRYNDDEKPGFLSRLDSSLIAPILAQLEEKYADHSILFICTEESENGEYSAKPSPYLLYRSNAPVRGADSFCERTAVDAGNFVPDGYSLLKRLLLI